MVVEKCVHKVQIVFYVEMKFMLSVSQGNVINSRFFFSTPCFFVMENITEILRSRLEL